MKIVALAGQKGGAGKTTLSAFIAAEFHRRGLKTLLVDLDPQGTATTWGDVAAESSHDIPTTVGMGDNVKTALPRLAQDYDRVVLDCPPRAGKRTAGALMVADVVLLPCQPSAADLWALQESLELVEQAQAIRDELKARVVLNAGLVSTTLSKDIIGALDDAGIERLGTVIHSRVDFKRALGEGQGVTVYAPKSKAATEIYRLVDELEAL